MNTLNKKHLKILTKEDVMKNLKDRPKPLEILDADVDDYCCDYSTFELPVDLSSSSIGYGCSWKSTLMNDE